MKKSQDQRWTEEEIKSLEENYLDYTLQEFKEEFMPYRTEISIRNKAQRLGLKKKRGGVRKYDVNLDFFDELNSESSYWLGFIAADGSVQKQAGYKSKSLQIYLSYKDKNHLLKLKEELSEHPLKERENNGSKMVSYTVTSNRLVEQLEEFGIVPRKTKKLDFPSIPSEYIRDFVRGYIDGDGSISIHKRKKGNTRLILRIIGNKQFLEELHRVIKNKADINPNSKVRKESNADIHSINYSGRSYVPDIMRWIYYDGCVCLNRKREKWQKYKEQEIS
ncbi:MAG: LAGLIDADG family homing endonuclease [Candidatus Nanohaloarchaea archaeon]